MVEAIKNYAKVEHLIYRVSEGQKFARPNDKLSALLDKYSKYLTEELSENDLEYVAAAKLPEIPKYKALKDV